VSGFAGNIQLVYVLAAACFVGSVGYLARPSDVWDGLGRAGKEHVRKHFLTPRLLRDWLRIFEGLR